jgi:multidrug efflux pump subunit AcrA (membrane-fusion protein)
MTAKSSRHHIRWWIYHTIRGSALVLLSTTAGCGDKTASTPAHATADEGPTAKATEQGSEVKGENDGDAHNAGTRVELNAAAFQVARIMTEVPRLDADASTGFTVPGQVEFDPARVAYISPRAAGRLERMLVVPGDRVHAEQPVALIMSPAYVTAQNDVLQAKRRADLLVGTPDAEGGQALLDAAHRRLALLDPRVETIRRLEAGNGPNTFLTVTAPFAGSIIESVALAGQAVEAGTPLGKIADLSVVNVAADVPERALFSLQPGQRATIRIAGMTQAGQIGYVTRISDQLDPQTRTAKALIRVPNTNRWLKPGMFATVTLRTTGNVRSAGALTIPASAVITEGAAQFVFIEIGSRTYERKPVELAPSVVVGTGPATTRVMVVSGLASTDRVVTQGAFTLKSELAKASLVDKD